MSKTTEPQKKEYDLVVIGSGPAGQRAAVCAAKLKKTVLVIEKEKVGGSCLHTGTIPSKSLREAALTSADRDTFKMIVQKTREIIQNESDVISQQLKRNNIEYIQGKGSLVSKNEVQIICNDKKSVVKAEYIILATGTRPRRPSQIEFDDTQIFDSDTVLNMQSHPKSIAIMGAGVIGCEYASIYARLGVKVYLVDVRAQLLPSIDQEIVTALVQQFKKYNIELLMGYDTGTIHKDKKSESCVEIEVIEKKSNKTKTLTVDSVLFCSGRIGNIEELNLDCVQVKHDERGLVKVNSNYQTNLSNIYAVGDLIGFPALAASGAEQGRLAALHAFSKKEVHFPATFPFGIYTIPEISSVGLQEAELKDQKREYVVGLALYRELARGKILHDDHGFLKLLVDANTCEILGVHVMGTGATELVHIGQVAMAFHASVEFFVDNVFNYPTLAEAYKVAALNASNKIKILSESRVCPI